MRFVHKPIDAIADPKEALMVLSIMFIHYLGTQLEERRKEIIGSSWCPSRTGGEGFMPAMSDKGTEEVVPLSNKIV